MSALTKKLKTPRSRFAQSRIEYITYGNPKGVSQMMFELGYEVPESIHDLTHAVRELIRKQGREVVTRLIKLHPDRMVILQSEQPKADNYCGACSNHSYNSTDNYCTGCGHHNYDGQNRQSFLDQLTAMDTSGLKKLYQNLLVKAKENPNDINLSKEIELAFEELRKRIAGIETDTSDDEGKGFSLWDFKSEAIVGILCLITGLIIASKNPFNQSN